MDNLEEFPRESGPEQVETEEERLLKIRLSESYNEGLKDGYDIAWKDLRNKAAIAAMQAIIPSQDGRYTIADSRYKYKDTAKWAVCFADELVEELKKNKK